MASAMPMPPTALGRQVVPCSRPSVRAVTQPGRERAPIEEERRRVPWRIDALVAFCISTLRRKHTRGDRAKRTAFRGTTPALRSIDGKAVSSRSKASDRRLAAGCGVHFASDESRLVRGEKHKQRSELDGLGRSSERRVRAERLTVDSGIVAGIKGVQTGPGT